MLDIDMLAEDMAALLSHEDYGIDVDSNDVKRGLGAFLSTITGEPWPSPILSPPPTLTAAEAEEVGRRFYPQR